MLTAIPLPGWADPEAVFLALRGRSDGEFWLDAGAEAASGWSILGFGAVEHDPAHVRATPLGSPAVPGPVPFAGGWVGWLAYEDGAAAAGAPTAVGATTSAWIAVDRAVAFDHARRSMWALASDGAEVHAGESWAAAVQAVPAEPIVTPPHPPAANTATARDGVARYVDLVGECRAAIRRGDAYQLCLTTQFSAPAPAQPVDAYRRLRRATPAHHGGYLRIGDRHLLSASPEQFIDVSGDVVRTSPIKGTRPRGATPEEDAALAAELRASEKERAENVMIVDLMRNDLSHIGVPGSVVVERLWEVESYPAVHQLVSTVSARLQADLTFGALCDAVFPAGSMTGAPKLSAMTILHGLERGPRGVYAGCFGHVGLDGTVDLAMVIRSIVVDGEMASVGAGGGITWLSEADAEAAEVATKARAPLAALGAKLPDDWAATLPDRR